MLYRLVHRLDKDATGCLVIARTADAAAWLSLAFAQHAKSATDADSVYTGIAAQPLSGHDNTALCCLWRLCLLACPLSVVPSLMQIGHLCTQSVLV